jgi:acetyl-CoA synthetase
MTAAPSWELDPEHEEFRASVRAFVDRGLANGMTVVCYEGAMDAPGNARFYEICEKHRVTKVLGAPTLLRMLRKYGDELAAAHPLPSLRLVTVQGEPLDGDTFTWASTHLGGGVPVVNASSRDA